MLTDIFKERYPNLLRGGDRVHLEVKRFLAQCASIIANDLSRLVFDFEQTCGRVLGQLYRELGYRLTDGDNNIGACGKSLVERYDLWNNAHGDAGSFVMNRLSLAELLFADIESEIRAQENQQNVAALNAALVELNTRFRQANMPFQYHGGKFQYSEDDLISDQVEDPFWNLVGDPKWDNVSIDMKEAIDRRDTQGRDAALYALKALESTLKIVSDDNGWTTGRERGAANYVDNLVSAANGRFIEVWEGDQLKALFGTVRNPHGHGPGAAPQPNLSIQQQSFVIENAMSWVKSIVSRI